MTTEPYRCSYTWTVTEGVSEKEVTVQMCESLTPEFAPIDELLDLDRCLILNGSDGQDSCEMRLSVIPLYLPRAISLVVECPVIECYHGRLNEYYKTYHGELVYTLGGVKVFRFDIRITTDLDELQLKFITPKNEPLCLYGTRLYLARNPNPLHSAMLRGRRINPASVQHRLQDTDLSEKAENCKRLVLGAMQSSEQNVTNNNHQPHAPAEQTTVLPDMTKDPEGNLTNLFSQMLLPGQSSHSSVLEMFMKQYIDQKFSELEQMFEMKLSSLESRQNKKLDQILTLLQGQHVDRPSSQPCDPVE
ncbi:hypothetical protein ZHAS_00006157 [Anopheles sinensis]|uniref:Uncharacterized protein n=1 Tax=Anopheles sinensis TaxID=74873 RepID=A0A084VLB2_ANOSI|nr:hypothetical protein ZHAS_00006157 [Anopheles sinensis]